MVFISKYLVPKGFTGIAIFPFVFLKSKHLKKDAVLINHEKIHLKQQLELLIIPFYIVYIIEFMLLLFQYKNKKKAYKNMSFEVEAYTNETNLNYLKERPVWAFLKYLSKHDV